MNVRTAADAADRGAVIGTERTHAAQDARIAHLVQLAVFPVAHDMTSEDVAVEQRTMGGEVSGRRIPVGGLMPHRAPQLPGRCEVVPPCRVGGRKRQRPEHMPFLLVTEPN